MGNTRGTVLGMVLIVAFVATCIAAKPAVEFTKIVPLEDLRQMKDTLKLTDEQVNKYRSLKDVYQGKVKDLIAQTATKQKELVELMKAEKTDAAAIDAKVKEIMAAELTEVSAAVQFYLDFSKNLSKEQATVFWAEAGKRFLKEETPKPEKAPAAKEGKKDETATTEQPAPEAKDKQKNEARPEQPTPPPAPEPKKN
ncbi:MAG: periplasmic heavy metal sensor [Acidobacteriota bacterium]